MQRTYTRSVMSEKRASENYRLCKVSFKVQFGNNPGKQSHSSSENVFKRSKRKECFGVVLAEICKQVGLTLVQSSAELSDRRLSWLLFLLSPIFLLF